MRLRSMRCPWEDEFERQCEEEEDHDGPHVIWGYDTYEPNMIVECENCRKKLTFDECGDYGYSEIWDVPHIFCSGQCFDGYFRSHWNPSEREYRRLVRKLDSR
jgi:hypothetical protein